MTPYEEMLASKPKATPGRPRLTEIHRKARQQAGTVARRRAIAVLKARYREEFNFLVRVEKAAVVAAFDRQIAESGTYDIQSV